MDEEAKVESERLARERGVFPEWERSIWGPDQTAARGPKGERIRPMRRLRNCNVTTVAPDRHHLDHRRLQLGDRAALRRGVHAEPGRRADAGRERGLRRDRAGAEGWYSEDLMRRIAEAGHIDFPEVPEKWQRVFVTANHIKPEWHIRMQAAFQEYNDSAISKTCNFANDASEEYVEEIYRLAYSLNCKGVTVYRDGSRDMQVLSTGSTAKKVQEQATSSGKAEARADLAQLAGVAAASGDRARSPRYPSSRASSPSSRPRTSGCGAWCTTSRRRTCSGARSARGRSCCGAPPGGSRRRSARSTSRSPRTTAGQPFEVFMSLGKAGGALMADVEALGRLISLALRSGIPMKEIYRQLRGISSDRVIGLGPNKILSVPDAVGIAIERWMQEKQGIQQELLPGGAAADGRVAGGGAAGGVQQRRRRADGVGGMQETLSGACPDCGSQLEFAEGCMKCHVCGFSECG